MNLETVKVSDLKPHPRNYRDHPDDQLEHIITSLKTYGQYRNIIVARDYTILAGHGVTKAAQRLEWETLEVYRLDLDPLEPTALKVLAGDNEISHLGMVDDRQLSELLKEIKDFDVSGLLGTGYDEAMLANLVMVTRPASEIADMDAAAEWLGMPGYENDETPRLKLVVTFRTDEDREDFVGLTKLRIDKRERTTWTTRWPFTEREDLAALRFKG